MGNRPTDWHVLDLDEDPVPGDPDRVKQLARELHDFADDVADALRQISYLTGIDDRPNGPAQFTLDSADMVTEVTAPGWQEHYTYDHLGNQTTAT